MTYKLRPLLLRQLRDDIAKMPSFPSPWHERGQNQIKEIDKALEDGGHISAELANELRHDLVMAWEGSSGDYRRKYWSQLKRFDEQTGNRVGNEDGNNGPVWH
jgi:nitric oxide synthase oxygenase domain/subunit